MIFPCPGLPPAAPFFPPFAVLDIPARAGFAFAGAGAGIEVGSSSEKDSHEASSFVTIGIVRRG